MPTLTHEFSPQLLWLASAAEPDAGLLARFAHDRDEAAFAVLVQRHGPMVLAVCRRALGDWHAAEDACQATFLALARNAARLRQPEALAAWLHGAAVRVSLNARRAAPRPALSPPDATGSRERDPLAEITGRELVAVIDAELARLPEALRAPLVLCGLEGMSHGEAARRLGWSPGSVKGRLERGRERLRRRLARRGLALSAASALLAASDATAAWSARLASETTQLALGEAAPPAVAALAETAAAAALPRRLLVAAVLAASLLGAAAVGGLDAPRPANPPPKAEARPEPAVPKTDRFGDPLPDGAILRLGTTRLRHPRVSSLAFNAANQLVSFGHDYVLRTWDARTGRQVAEKAFEKERMWRSQAGFLSPDARLLAVQYDRLFKVYDTASGRELASVALTEPFNARAEFPPDGKSVAVCDGRGELQLFELATVSLREFGQLGEYSQDITFSRDGRRLAVAAVGPGALVFDVSSGRRLMTYKANELLALRADLDATGELLSVIGSGRSGARLVKVATGEAMDGMSVPAKFDPHWVRFVDNSTALFGERDGVHLFDLKANKILRTAPGPASKRAAFSADGRLMASAGDHAMQVWDAKTGRPVPSVDAASVPAAEIGAVALTPDGRSILTRESEARSVRVWGLDGNLKTTIPADRWGGQKLLLSPDGRNLYCGAADGIVLVRRDVTNGAEIARYPFAGPPEDQAGIIDFALSGDGRQLVALTLTIERPVPRDERGMPIGIVMTFTVWDAATARRLSYREFETSAADRLGRGQFTPDLKWYCSGRKVIPLAGGPEVRLNLPAKWLTRTDIAVSPDGRLIAQGMEEQVTEGSMYWSEPRGVIVSEAATGNQVMNLTPGKCGRVAFTPDGRGLIVAGNDAITRWDLSTRKPVVRHASPPGVVAPYWPSFASSLAVTPDGNRALTGHVDTTAILWDLPSPPRAAKRLSERDLAGAWAALTGDDAGRAYAAIWSLADAAPDALPFLRTRLRPIPAPNEAEVRELIARLASDKFVEREAAAKALRPLGPAIAPLLRAALAAGPGAEQRVRLERLLADVTAPALPPGERLRQVRAVAVLELIASDEARRLLDTLAHGAPGDRVTEEAAAALARLRIRR